MRFFFGKPSCLAISNSTFLSDTIYVWVLFFTEKFIVFKLAVTAFTTQYFHMTELT